MHIDIDISPRTSLTDAPSVSGEARRAASGPGFWRHGGGDDTHTNRGTVFIVSAYEVKLTDGQAMNEEHLRSKLQNIEEPYDRVKVLTLSNGIGTQVDLLLYADLNRHHVLWVSARTFGKVGRNDEAEPTIDFTQENALTSSLPSGAWEHYNVPTYHTINVSLATGYLGKSCEYY